MTLATRITYARLALIPFIIFFYLGGIYFDSYFFMDFGKLIALILFVIAAATDALDGYIARSRDMVTDHGKLIDPIMDKLLTLAGLLLVFFDPYLSEMMPLWAGILVLFTILGRDYIVSAIRNIYATRGIAMAADQTAKVKSAVLFIAIGLFMGYAAWADVTATTRNNVGTFYDGWIYSAWFLMLSAAVLSVISLVVYINKLISPAPTDDIAEQDIETKEGEEE